jgi:hypothetical protein
LDWSKKPIHTLVYSIIENKRNILFTDLVKHVKETLEDVSEEEIRRVLLKLEIWGKIAVETEGNNRRIVLRREE